MRKSNALAQAMLRCGKHAGRRYQDVAATDKNYCAWVLRERSEGKRLPRDLRGLANYIRQNFGGVVEIGKYKGFFFGDVLTRDPDYGDWVMSLDNPSKPMAEFAKYLKEQSERKMKRPREGVDLCSICMDHPIDSALIPCGHQCACIECARRLHERGPCPICRERIADVLQTFLAAASSGGT